MARYSRRRGPEFDFALSTAPTRVPGMTITRFFDEGELLILAHARIREDAALANQVLLIPVLDGARLYQATHASSLVASGNLTMALTFLSPIAAGIHTLELQASVIAATAAALLADSAELVAIQLPSWDSDADITTL